MVSFGRSKSIVNPSKADLINKWQPDNADKGKKGCSLDTVYNLMKSLQAQFEEFQRGKNSFAYLERTLKTFNSMFYRIQDLDVITQQMNGFISFFQEQFHKFSSKFNNSNLMFTKVER